VLAGPSQPATNRYEDFSNPPDVRRVADADVPAAAGAASSSSTSRSIGTPRRSRAVASTSATSICRISVRCGNPLSGRARSASRTETRQCPSRSSACGAVSPRSSSASVTPSGRSASSVRGCVIIALDGRDAAARRSTTRTVAPCADICRAVVRPVGPAPTTSTSARPRLPSCATASALRLLALHGRSAGESGPSTMPCPSPGPPRLPRAAAPHPPAAIQRCRRGCAASGPGGHARVPFGPPRWPSCGCHHRGWGADLTDRRRGRKTCVRGGPRGGTRRRVTGRFAVGQGVGAGPPARPPG
jgi:hypothetical protein